MGKLLLWGVGASRTLRAHWALHELGLDYETKPIRGVTGETRTDEYSKLAPRQKIPLLQDGDFAIAESAAIVAYLAETYGDSIRLIPESKQDYATWLEWSFFTVTELEHVSLNVIFRHRELQHIYGSNPHVVDKAAEYFGEQSRHVEAALSDGRKFLLGDQFTSADILLGTCLHWATQYKVGISPSSGPYLERLMARPAFQRAFAANTVN